MPGISIIEGHPIFHDWYVKGDYVAERGGLQNSIRVVRRVEGCRNCGMERFTLIDVTTWTHSKRRYRKAPGQTVLRIGKAEYLRKEFIMTSPNGEILEEIR